MSADRAAALATLTSSPLGYGAANVGNLYQEMSDEAAWAVLQAAWDSGIRYFDTAPHYGLGLSERRLGAFLATKPREEFVLSTKVGRLLVPHPDGAGGLDLANDFVVPTDLRRVWDFSADGIERSVDASLQRLGLDRLDVIYLHDPERYDLQGALATGLPGAARLRDDGRVAGIGVGSMVTAALAAALDSEVGIDAMMVAGRYTVLDTSAAAVLDTAAGSGVSVVLASVFNSGLLATETLGPDARFEYGPVPERIARQHATVVGICREFGVPLAAVALQFGRRHPSVASVVVGTGRPAQITANVANARIPVPEELWHSLDALLDR